MPFIKPRTLVTSLRRAILAVGALSATGVAFAQDAPQPAPQDKDAKTLDTITVTAQSREQELQDVPIALQVVNEALLQDVAAENLGDIDVFVPGLEIDAVQPTQPGFKLRGIATDDFGIGTDPAVGVFVDGVYGGRGGGERHLRPREQQGARGRERPTQETTAAAVRLIESVSRHATSPWLTSRSEPRRRRRPTRGRATPRSRSPSRR